MFILGIWDGHDSGVALLKDSNILFSINEERLSKRKLEVSFPEKSIEYSLNYSGLKKEDIKVIATGGLSTLIHSETNSIDYVDKFLTLEGLRLIYSKNK